MEIIQNISDFIPFGVTVMITVVFASIVINSILKIETFKKYVSYLGKSFIIICLPGIVTHEFGHFIFCLITGTSVRKVKFFTLGDPKVPGAVGYVDCEDPESFLGNFLISVGPAIINGLCVGLLLYYLPNLHEAIKYYLIFTLTLSALPSPPDLRSIFVPFNTNAKRSLYELTSCFVALIPALFAGTWNAHSAHEINWVYFMSAYFMTLILLIGCYKAATVSNQ
ncbi:MAG: hypothetical protein ACFFDN_08035 [Candidatus Hodarchaeota archaeon]